jgi:hypothetical protein
VLIPRATKSIGLLVVRPTSPTRAIQGIIKSTPNTHLKKVIIGTESSAIRYLPIAVKATTQNDATIVQIIPWFAGDRFLSPMWI